MDFGILPKYLETDEKNRTYIHYIDDIPKKRRLLIPKRYSLKLKNMILLKYGRILLIKSRYFKIYQIIDSRDGDSILLLDKRIKLEHAIKHGHLLAISPNDNKIIYSSNKNIYMYDMDKRENKRILGFKPEDTSIISTFIDDEYVHVLSLNMTYIFDSTGKIIFSIKEPTTIPTKFNDTIVIFSFDNVYLYNVNTAKVTHPENFQRFRDYWLDVKNKKIVAGSIRKNKLIIGEWDAETGKELSEKKELPFTPKLDFIRYVKKYYQMDSRHDSNFFPLSEVDKEKFSQTNLELLISGIKLQLAISLIKIINKFIMF
jgi:hypothetical protein